MSRRGVLGAAAGVAAAGAASLVAGASPASANNHGQSWTLGNTNTATDNTSLTATLNDRAALKVVNPGTAAANRLRPGEAHRLGLPVAELHHRVVARLVVPRRPELTEHLEVGAWIVHDSASLRTG